MAKKTISWKWGGKTYSGTIIRKTAEYIYANTHINKVKKIKRK
mgnify:FL=1